MQFHKTAILVTIKIKRFAKKSIDTNLVQTILLNFIYTTS